MFQRHAIRRLTLACSTLRFVGHDGAFSTGYLIRGNLTKTSRSLLDNNGNATEAMSSYAQYDIAGNVVKKIDGNGNSTSFDFTDNYGSPDDDARSNQARLN